MSGTIAPISLANIAAGVGGFVIYGQDAGDQSGYSVASAGDINGDGFADLIIGAPRGNGPSSSPYDGRGESYVVFGKASGWDAPIDLAVIANGVGGFVINGQDGDDGSGSSVASAGDINGDGFADLIIGAFRGDATGNGKDRAGESYVVFGKASPFGASIDLATIAAGSGGFVISGQDRVDYAGSSVASAGDINGDGFDDLIIGAPSADGAGNAKNSAGDTYVVFGKASGWGGPIDLAVIAGGTGGFVINGQDANDRSGQSVAPAGDINGDGFADLIIGALNGDGNNPNSSDNRGESYIIFGKLGGWEVNQRTPIWGQDFDDRSGRSVASAGDVNGDGLADLLIGAPNGDGANNGKSNAGDSYVIFGKTSGWDQAIDLGQVAAGTGGFVIHGQDTSDAAGNTVASAGDVNGDGYDDLIIAASGGDAAGNAKSGAGETYVVFGRSSGWGAPIDLATVAAGMGGFVIYGQDAYDQSSFSVAPAGDINGDGFDDLIIGARSADAAGNAKAAAGDSYVVFGRDFTNSVTHAGSAGADVLTGTASANVMVGGLGNDTLIGRGGADALQGGAGDDRLVVSDLTFLRVDGGSGTDTLVVSGTGLTLDLKSIGDSKLKSIEMIDLGANTLRLTALELAGLSDIVNTIRVIGDTGAALVFDDAGWIKVSSLNGVSTYANGAVMLEVASSIPATSSLNSINLLSIAAGIGGFVLHGRDAGDQSGYSVASAGDINGDGFDDLIVGASGGAAENNAKWVAGESYVIFGKPSGWGGPIDLTAVAGGTGGFIFFGQDSGDRSGTSVASAGDINGDGFADLIIGAPWADGIDNTLDAAGGVYVIFGKSNGWGATLNAATVAAGTGGFVIHGQDAGDQTGFSVATAGDINGDGFADLLVGARGGNGADNATGDVGETYVVFGKASGWGTPLNLANIAAGHGGFVIFGEDVGDGSGVSVAPAGDINADGFSDLIIGARGGDAASNAKPDAGSSYVVFGKASGWGAPVDLASVAGGTGGFVIYGRDSEDLSGHSVASAGDINGDGFADLIIGAYAGDGPSDARWMSGDSFVVFGSASGWGAPVDLGMVAAGTGGFVIHGESVGDKSGRSVASAGDVNGDGFDDIIIGANYKSGKSYVVFGRATGWAPTIDLADVASNLGGFVIYGQDPKDYSGWSVASAGDVNGDGFDDVMVGAIFAYGSRNLKAEAGDTYVIFGRDFTNAVTHAGTDSAEVLIGTSSANVMVAGLGNDTLIGQGGADALQGGTGDDLLVVSDFTFLRVDGGSGTDTLALNGAGLTLNLASIADTKLQSIEAIDLGSGWNTLRLTALEVRNLSETSNTLRVTGGLGAGIQFDDTGWVQGATADGFVTFTNGTATVIVAQALLAPPPGPTTGNDNIAGSSSNDIIDGLAGNDSIFGAAGNDILVGGAGADTLGGGAGNDLFLMTDAGDLVIEAAGGGADTIIASVSMTIPDQVEVLQIASGISGITITGGSGNDMLMGNGLANNFNGGAGDDVILAGNVTLADIYALFAT